MVKALGTFDIKSPGWSGRYRTSFAHGGTDPASGTSSFELATIARSLASASPANSTVERLDHA
jgi:hypothetical protein